ncbi:MAG TPA: hypothetical protein PK358_12230 [Spirochaetota bacterium]|nr:hypothetical protein [Spirochaetota bacterium]HPJ35598.1 hypothetical protein [Spirochaetota bacterium]
MKRFSWKAAVLSVIIFFYGADLYPQGKQTSVIDTPTAFTIARGTYKVSLLEYDNGGMEFKTFLGLHDIIYLGVSLDVQSAIGRDDPGFNVPGVIARLKFTDGHEAFPIAIAAGYDSFYTGYEGLEEDDTEDEKDDLNRVIYGPYLVFTGSIYLFDSEQYLSVGVRTPTQPDYIPDNTSYFTSIDIPLGEFFRFQFEVERVYWNFRDADDWLFNPGIKFNYFDQVFFTLGVMIENDERPNRIIRFEYHGEF